MDQNQSGSATKDQDIKDTDPIKDPANEQPKSEASEKEEEQK